MYGTERGNTSGGYSLFQFMVLNDTGLTTPTTYRSGKSPVPLKSLLTCRKNVVYYTVTSSNPVKIDVVDSRGRQVTTLIDGFKHAGDHEAVLPGRLGSGMFIIRLTIGANKLVTKHVNL
jgi:hypothetical protein